MHFTKVLRAIPEHLLPLLCTSASCQLADDQYVADSLLACRPNQLLHQSTLTCDQQKHLTKAQHTGLHSSAMHSLQNWDLLLVAHDCTHGHIETG
jgi:hypothetical protein